jgi:hypothetical protein
MESVCRVYRPRDPRKTPLWGLLDTLYERVKGEWEELRTVEGGGVQHGFDRKEAGDAPFLAPCRHRLGPDVAERGQLRQIGAASQAFVVRVGHPSRADEARSQSSATQPDPTSQSAKTSRYR